ncbi:MAG: DeoR/GlpR family DNA-binding transcription regulator [Planctomycetota bacterium]
MAKLKDRKIKIIEFITRNGFARAEDLAELFGVSSITVRRDFIELEEEKLIRRVHGGATTPDAGLSTRHITWRRTLNVDTKAAVARYAASIIKPNETMFIDAGSTCRLLAENLPEHRNLTVITHSLDVITVLAHRQGIRLIAAGGLCDDRMNAFIGPVAEATLLPFTADRAFLGTAALSTEQGSINNTIEETAIKRAMRRMARRPCLLADGSKFGQEAFYATLPAAEIKCIITDSSAPTDAVARFRKAGVEVLIAED